MLDKMLIFILVLQFLPKEHFNYCYKHCTVPVPTDDNEEIINNFSVGIGNHPCFYVCRMTGSLSWSFSQ